MLFDRTKNAKRNSFWGIVSKLAGLFMPFATRTVLIYKLGMNYAGLNSLFTSILSVLNLSELGIGSAVVYFMYKPISENDYVTIKALMRLYKRLYQFIGMFILTVGLCVIPFLPKLIRADIPNGVNLQVLYIIYLANTVISYWLFAYKNCLLHAYQRDDIISKINLLVTSGLYFTQIIVLLIADSYYLYVIFIPLANVLQNVLNARCSKRLFPELVCEGSLDSAFLSSFKEKVYGLALIKVAAASRNALDSIVLSVYIGLSVVGIYNNYFYVINALASVLMVLTNSISSIIGNSVAVDSLEMNYERFRFLNFSYMLLVGFCTSCLICAIQPFMTIWTGNDKMFTLGIATMFAVYFYFARIGDVQAQFFDAAGLWWNGRWRGVIEASINVFLNFLLGRLWGVLGIIAATIISIVLVNIPLATFFTFSYYFKCKPRGYIYDHLRVLCFSTFECIVTFRICTNIPVPNSRGLGLLYIMVRLLICIALYIPLSYLIFKNNRYYHRMCNTIKSIVLK